MLAICATARNCKALSENKGDGAKIKILSLISGEDFLLFNTHASCCGVEIDYAARE